MLVRRDLVATIAIVIDLVELVSIHFLHLDSLVLLVVEAMLGVSAVFNWQMVVLSMMLSCASVVALRISLARMSALLLDENTFQACSCASVRDHHLLGIIKHLGIVDTA